MPSINLSSKLLLSLSCLATSTLAVDYPAQSIKLEKVQAFLPAVELAQLLKIPVAMTKQLDFYQLPVQLVCSPFALVCPNTTRYIINNPQLSISELEPSIASGSYQITKQTNLAHLATMDENRYKTIQPALYPINRHTSMIALLEQTTQGFSGGGASYVIGNFYSLANLGETAKLYSAYQQVPFYMSQLFRGCFSIEDYNSSPHCHEENKGHLEIDIQMPKARQANYRWQLTWYAKYWPAGVTKIHTRHSKTVLPAKGKINLTDLIENYPD